MIVGRRGALVCAVVSIPLLARAEPPAAAAPLAVALEYEATPSCPDVDEFKTVVMGRLGYDPFREGAPDRVLVHIAPSGRTVEGRVEWRNAAGKWTGDRTFPSRNDDCRELVRAMGFALALQIQLLAIVSAPQRSGAAPDETNRPPPAAPPPAPPPVTTAPPPRPVASVTDTTKPPGRGPGPALALGAGASVGFGLSSSAVPLGRIFGSVAWPHAALELAGEIGLPETTRRADGAGFSQQLLLASAAGCGAYERWSACLLAKAGEIRIVGLNISVPASPSGPIFEAGLRVGLMQRLGRRAYLAGHAEGLTNVTRWRVTLDSVPVWTAPRFAATLGVDAAVSFP